jgi:hypothetical protein
MFVHSFLLGIATDLSLVAGFFWDPGGFSVLISVGDPDLESTRYTHVLHRSDQHLDPTCHIWNICT